MKNPPKKPKAPRGYRRKWIKAYSYQKFVRRRRTIHGKYEKIFKKVVVPSHYNLYKSAVPEKARRKEERRVKKIVLPDWQRARSYEDMYRREYDAASVDPIYRFNRERDVVKVAGALAGLVWDHPVRQDVRGSFDTVRVWYVVRHETQGETFVYVRTFKPGYSFDSLSLAETEARKAEGAILGEYEGKSYMEVVRFIGWTAFNSVVKEGKNLHRWKVKGDTKEKAYQTRWRHALRKPFELKTKTGQSRVVEREVSRVLTPWEVKKALAAFGGKSVGLKMKKGQSVQDAFKNLSAYDKRFYRKKLSRAVELLEERWEKERRGL